MSELPTYTAFLGPRRLLTAPLRDLLTFLHAYPAAPGEPLLILNDATGRAADFDLRGPLEDVLARAEPPALRSGPGRPRLGVTSREVSLLPRHWDWLDSHPGGVSAALRRLIDEARRADPQGETRRLARLATDRALSTLAGNQPGAEDASRALYAADASTFRALMQDWPPDLRDHLLHLSAPAFSPPEYAPGDAPAGVP